MRLDWILVRIGLNFNFLVSKWHLIASMYPKFDVQKKFTHVLSPIIKRPFNKKYQFVKKLPKLGVYVLKAYI